MYFLAGYCCFFSGLDLAPYKVFYAIAALGYISLALKISQVNKNDLRFRTKSRIHRNWVLKLNYNRKIQLSGLHRPKATTQLERPGRLLRIFKWSQGSFIVVSRLLQEEYYCVRWVCNVFISRVVVFVSLNVCFDSNPGSWILKRKITSNCQQMTWHDSFFIRSPKMWNHIKLL